MKFSAFIVIVLPSLCVAGLLDNIALFARHGSFGLVRDISVNYVKRASDDLVQRASLNFVKRAPCNTANWITGLKAIESSISILSSRFVGVPNSPPCPSVNLTAFLQDQRNLISRVSTEAAAIAGCAPSVTNCANVQAEVTNTLLPLVSRLSSAVIAKTREICCNSLAGVGRAQASSLSTAITNYATSIKAKLPPGTCIPVATSDLAVITSIIQAGLTKVPC